MKADIAQTIYVRLQREIAEVVDAARSAAARSVNALMTGTYWEVGRRIVEFGQKGEERAAYGEAPIRRLGADLSQWFGREPQTVPTPSAISDSRSPAQVAIHLTRVAG